jgi:hypothetical protein
MNHILMLTALLFTLSLCNLTDRLKGKAGGDSSSNTNSSSSTSPSGSSGASTGQVERPKPTAA